MRQIVSTVSSKGQITIPIAVRRHLGIKQGDKLLFIIEGGGEVRVRVMRYRDVASLTGAAGSLKKPLSWEEVIEIARER